MTTSCDRKAHAHPGRDAVQLLRPCASLTACAASRFGVARRLVLARRSALLARGRRDPARARPRARLLALADPSLVREDRETVKDVVAVVVDRSSSQTLGDRPARPTRARGARSAVRRAQRRRAALHRRPDDGDGDDGTRLFAALSQASPTCRRSGSRRAAGHRRRGPRHPGHASRRWASGRRSTSSSPAARTSATAGSSSSRRRASASSARTRRSGRRCMERGGTGAANVTVRRDGEVFARRSVRTGAPFSLHGPGRAWRPERGRARGRAPAGRADAR